MKTTTDTHDRIAIRRAAVHLAQGIAARAADRFGFSVECAQAIATCAVYAADTGPGSLADVEGITLRALRAELEG
jgi:hypothetical protein